MTTEYSPTVLANLLNITERRLQQLSKDNIIPPSVNGKYELIGTVKGYVTYLQQRAAGREVGADAKAIYIERKRLIRAQAIKTESRHAKLRGELIAVDLVSDALNEVATLLGSSLDSLPGRVSQDLASMNEPAEIKDTLFIE